MVKATNATGITLNATICMENEAGRKIWVPKSAILGEAPTAPTETPGSFSLKGWFVKKKEIKEWMAGA